MAFAVRGPRITQHHPPARKARLSAGSIASLPIAKQKSSDAISWAIDPERLVGPVRRLARATCSISHWIESSWP